MSSTLGPMLHNESTIKDYHSTIESTPSANINFSEQDIKDYGENLTENIGNAEECNRTIYFICPNPNPLLQKCASIGLTSEYQVIIYNDINHIIYIMSWFFIWPITFLINRHWLLGNGPCLESLAQSWLFSDSLGISWPLSCWVDHKCIVLSINF